MRIHNIICGTKADIPEKYLESIFQLMQKSEREFHPFEPAHIDFHRKSWLVPDLSWTKTLRFVGTDKNDEVVSYAWLSYNTKYDNLEQTWHFIHLQENEEKKNNRIIMLKEIVNNIPEQIKTMYAWYLKDSKEESFYDKIKDEQAYEEFLYVANLEEQNLEDVSLKAQESKEKALQKGYDIIFVDNLRYKENVNYTKFVKLIECIWNDMPREQLSEDNTKLTVERYDEQCENNQQKWETFLSFIAIEKKTNNPVGITVSVIGDYQPDVAWQWDTGVLHEHRGHGLGLALKYQMLEKLLDYTNTKTWYTGSSSVNTHMNRINEILGYKKWNSEVVFELTKEELQNFLSKV